MPFDSLRSFRSIYERGVERPAGAAGPPVTEADLAALPPPLATYLRRAGVVGRPPARVVRSEWRGEMRTGRDAAWMPVRVEQVDFFDPPARHFLMKASRWGIPFEALHVYADGAARMRVRLAGLVGVLDVSGPELTQSETVTLFNDMCLLAPSTLLAPSVRFTAIDERQVRGTFTNAGHTIGAVLAFDASGDLVDFVSEDRYQSDGRGHRRLPWRTPVRDFREFGDHRVAAHGDACWREPDGEWTYARFDLEALDVDPGQSEWRSAGTASVIPIAGGARG